MLLEDAVDDTNDQHEETAAAPSRRSSSAAPPEVEEVLNELTRVNNELLATQRALQRKNAEVDRAAERLNTLLGMAAHDLRNPAGSIRGFAETLLLRARDRLDERELEILQRIVAASNRMLRLVHELLDLSEVEHNGTRLELVECDLRDVLDEAIDIAGVAARDKEIDLTLAAPASMPVVADPANLTEVVMNLLTNAVKYSHRGSRVEVAATADDDTVTIEVADEGVGIPEEDLELLFQPFSRASPRPTEGEGSTGLGLAIAARVVRAHGGEVRATSQLGEGSVFTVTLPRVARRHDD